MSMDKKIEKQFWTKKRISQYSGFAIVIIVILYFVLTTDSSSRLNVDSERITISEVSEGPFQVYIPVSGNILPIKTVYLDAVEGGRIEQVIRESGSQVFPGDTILVMSNTNLLLGIMNREAQLFEQRNNLRNTRLLMEQNSLNLEGQIAELKFQKSTAKRDFDRDKLLFERELISDYEFDESKERYEYYATRYDLTLKTQKQDSLFRNLQIEMLEASVDRIQNNLDFIRGNLDNLILRAPVGGLLSSLNAEVGESKSQGQRLGQIDILDGYKVRAEIDEYYIARLEAGLLGKFDLNGKEYVLKVTKIYPEVRDGRFQIDLEFDGETPLDIRRGQTMHIRLALGDLTKCVQVYRGAFYQSTGGNWVFVLDKSGEFATKREIKVGRMNPRAFEILEGLEPGDRVITSSYDNFGEVEKLVLNNN